MSDDLNGAIAAATDAAVAESGGDGRAGAATGGETPVATGGEATPAPDSALSRARDASGRFVKADGTPAEAPAAEPEPVEPEPETDPLEVLSREDLDRINGDPLMRKMYKTVLRGFHSKSEKFAAEKGQLAERLQIVDWIQSDPENAIRTLARAKGINLAEPAKSEAQTAVDDVEKLAIAQFGPEGADTIKLLRPIIEKVAEQLVEQRIAPDRQQLEALRQAAASNAIAGALKAFGAERQTAEEPWDDSIQAEMHSIMQRVKPGENVDIKDYLAVLYNNAVAERDRKTRVKANIDRLKKASTKTETPSNMRPAPVQPRSVTADMSDKDAIALAVELAQADAR